MNEDKITTRALQKQYKGRKRNQSILWFSRPMSEVSKLQPVGPIQPSPGFCMAMI